MLMRRGIRRKQRFMLGPAAAVRRHARGAAPLGGDGPQRHPAQQRTWRTPGGPGSEKANPESPAEPCCDGLAAGATPVESRREAGSASTQSSFGRKIFVGIVARSYVGQG